MLSVAVDIIVSGKMIKNNMKINWQFFSSRALNGLYNAVFNVNKVNQIGEA